MGAGATAGASSEAGAHSSVRSSSGSGGNLGSVDITGTAGGMRVSVRGSSVHDDGSKGGG